MAAKSKENNNRKADDRRPMPLAGFAIGIILLIACVIASVMLVTEHFGANLPGWFVSIRTFPSKAPVGASGPTDNSSSTR